MKAHKTSLYFSALVAFFGVCVVAFFTLFASVKVAAQNRAPSSAVEITALQGKLQGLRRAEDSTVSLLASSRALYQSDAENRQKHSLRVLNLESQLYDLRSRIEELTSQVTMLEMRSFEAGFSGASAGSGAGSSLNSAGAAGGVLWGAPFFRSNLSGKDLEVIGASGRVQGEVRGIIAEIDSSYGELVQLKKVYDSTSDQDELDRAGVRGNLLLTQIRELDQQIRMLWGKVYNYKMDTFLVLGDKAELDRTTLETLEQESRQVRRQEGLSEGSLAPSAEVFDAQRVLVLKHELELAKRLGIRGAVDSLAAAVAAAALSPTSITSSASSSVVVDGGMKYGEVVFAPRSLVVYGEIRKAAGFEYGSVNDIPQVRVPERGVYYTIQVAAMSRPASSVTMFKGMGPLQQQKLASGVYRYMLGGFRTYAEAQKAVNQLYKVGFKAPTMLAWVNGASTTAVKAKGLEATVGGSSSSAASAVSAVSAGQEISGYKVEVTGAASSDLSMALKNIVQMHSPGKQIMRTAKGEELVFTVTSYSSKEEAEVIAQIIRTKGYPQVKVLEIRGV